MSIRTQDEVVEAIRADLASIEEDVTTRVTVADLIRQGAAHTVHYDGWGQGEEACALSAAAMSAKALGFIGE